MGGRGSAQPVLGAGVRPPGRAGPPGPSPQGPRGLRDLRPLPYPSSLSCEDLGAAGLGLRELGRRSGHRAPEASRGRGARLACGRNGLGAVGSRPAGQGPASDSRCGTGVSNRGGARPARRGPGA